MNKLNKKVAVAATLAVALTSTGALADWRQEFEQSPVSSRRGAVYRSITSADDLRYSNDSDDEGEVVRARVSQQTRAKQQFTDESARTPAQPTTVWTKLYGILNSLKKAIFG